MKRYYFFVLGILVLYFYVFSKHGDRILQYCLPIRGKRHFEGNVFMFNKFKGLTDKLDYLGVMYILFGLIQNKIVWTYY